MFSFFGLFHAKVFPKNSIIIFQFLYSFSCFDGDLFLVIESAENILNDFLVEDKIVLDVWSIGLSWFIEL